MNESVAETYNVFPTVVFIVKCEYDLGIEKKSKFNATVPKMDQLRLTA